MSKPRKPKCLTPGCERPARARGCCEPCYRCHLRAVLSGVTTWAKLIRSGLATLGKIAPATAARESKGLDRAKKGKRNHD